jgi:exonuclease III
MKNKMTALTNINGLNTLYEIGRFSEWIETQEPSTCYVQETHLKSSVINRERKERKEGKNEGRKEGMEGEREGRKKEKKEGRAKRKEESK